MADFGFEPAKAVAHLQAADPALARIIEQAGPFAMELKKARSVFAALAEAIVYQQLSNKAAATIFGRVCGAFPARLDGPHARAAAGAVRRQDPRRRHIAAQAQVAARPRPSHRRRRGADLAAARRMEDAEIVERLIAIHGIGRWSAEMFLMFYLGRPDVLPLDDYSLRKAYATAFRKRTLPSREALEKAGEKWRPYRTVASWYLWQTLNRP